LLICSCLYHDLQNGEFDATYDEIEAYRKVCKERFLYSDLFAQPLPQTVDQNGTITEI